MKKVSVLSGVCGGWRTCRVFVNLTRFYSTTNSQIQTKQTSKDITSKMLKDVPMVNVSKLNVKNNEDRSMNKQSHRQQIYTQAKSLEELFDTLISQCAREATKLSPAEWGTLITALTHILRSSTDYKKDVQTIHKLVTSIWDDSKYLNESCCANLTTLLAQCIGFIQMHTNRGNLNISGSNNSAETLRTGIDTEYQIQKDARHQEKDIIHKTIYKLLQKVVESDNIQLQDLFFCSRATVNLFTPSLRENKDIIQKLCTRIIDNVDNLNTKHLPLYLAMFGKHNRIVPVVFINKLTNKLSPNAGDLSLAGGIEALNGLAAAGHFNKTILDAVKKYVLAYRNDLPYHILSSALLDMSVFSYLNYKHMNWLLRALRSAEDSNVSDKSRVDALLALASMGLNASELLPELDVALDSKHSFHRKTKVIWSCIASDAFGIDRYHKKIKSNLRELSFIVRQMDTVDNPKVAYMLMDIFEWWRTFVSEEGLAAPLHRRRLFQNAYMEFQNRLQSATGRQLVKMVQSLSDDIVLKEMPKAVLTVTDTQGKTESDTHTDIHTHKDTDIHEDTDTNNDIHTHTQKKDIHTQKDEHTPASDDSKAGIHTHTNTQPHMPEYGLETDPNVWYTNCFIPGRRGGLYSMSVYNPCNKIAIDVRQVKQGTSNIIKSRVFANMGVKYLDVPIQLFTNPKAFNFNSPAEIIEKMKAAKDMDDLDAIIPSIPYNRATQAESSKN